MDLTQFLSDIFSFKIPITPAVVLPMLIIATAALAYLSILLRCGLFVAWASALDSGDEGYVERIGWRSTRIRMLPNKTAVVPNSKLVQSTIINYV